MTFALRAASTLLLAIGSLANAQQSEANVEIVGRFVDAYNAQDPKAMEALVADDVTWLSVAGESIAVEARGRDELLSSMATYFAGCPTCRASLSDFTVTSQRVSAVETASWQKDGAMMSQRALAVYELTEGRISRVYYFSAEP